MCEHEFVKLNFDIWGIEAPSGASIEPKISKFNFTNFCWPYGKCKLYEERRSAISMLLELVKVQTT